MTVTLCAEGGELSVKSSRITGMLGDSERLSASDLAA